MLIKKITWFVLFVLLLTFWTAVITCVAGCVPDVPEIPAIPTGAICMPNNFYMTLPEMDLGDETLNSVLEPVTHVMDYVYDDTGAALMCEFTYE